jgi:hypothetical protein
MLWGVTAYFNPAGYKTRRENYLSFRKYLKVPLVAVEMSPTGQFQLRSEDAEILIQLRGGDVLWQKERLLNIGLKHLPPSCDIVAWLDCDVIFGDDQWPARTGAALDSFSLVQLFSERCNLPRGVGHDSLDGFGAYPWLPSRGYKIATGRYPCEREQRNAGIPVADYSAPGQAWAARRSLLEKHGLYDARIVGSGDVAILTAALGEFDHYLKGHAMNDRQIEHYRNWGDPFFADVAGRVGYVSGRLYHLWHGDRSDRQYVIRQHGVMKADFDPFTDIALDATGCWRWNSAKPELHSYVKGYFASRKEDGPQPASELMA